jgi:hypothetical protein
MLKRNNPKVNYLFISKSYAHLQRYLSMLLLGFIAFALLKLGYLIFGIIFISLLLWIFSKVPIHVYFYEEKFIATYLFRQLEVTYTDVSKIAFLYAGPSLHPALVIFCNQKKIGFEWGADSKYLTELLKFFLSKQITIYDPDDLLRNYIDKSKLSI